MKRLLASASLLALSSVAVSAADLPMKAPPMAMPVPVFSWTGCYVGAHVGGGSQHDSFTQDNSFTSSPFSSSGEGVMAVTPAPAPAPSPAVRSAVTTRTATRSSVSRAKAIGPASRQRLAGRRPLPTVISLISPRPRKTKATTPSLLASVSPLTEPWCTARQAGPGATSPLAQ